jgi:hypothetical protein
MDWTERTCSGKLFQTRGPAVLKALSPSNVNMCSRNINRHQQRARQRTVGQISDQQTKLVKRGQCDMTVHYHVDNGGLECIACIQLSRQSVIFLCTHIKMLMSLPQVCNCGRTPAAFCVQCYSSCNRLLW